MSAFEEAGRRNGSFFQVLRLTIPVAMAYVPLGIAFGVFLVASGINWYWAPISAMLIFAGSIEFLAVTFIVASLPLAVIGWTTFIVNFRHIFYGLSFPIERLKTLGQKIYGIFALTDETYAITSAGEGRTLTGPQITLLQFISHLWWVGGAFIGAWLGQLIPSDIHGFEFALTAMFIILAVDAVRHNRNIELLIYALGASVAGYISDKYVIDNSFLITGLIIYFLLLTGSYFRKKGHSDDR